MNKIEIVNDKITKKDLNDSIIINQSSFKSINAVSHIEIDIVKNSTLLLKYENDLDNKMAITFKIEPNVTLNLNEIRTGTSNKIRYEFNLDDNSNLNVVRFYDVDNSKELDIFNLNGLNSKLNYEFKTISTNKEKYDIVVNHNNSNTISNIINKAVNIKDGSVKINVSSFVPKGNVKCEVNQNSKIINLTNNKCQINPNLLIDEYDVTASHSANICKFSFDEMFYLKSRGLDEKEALNLLIKGFLMENIKHEKHFIEKTIDKYRR